MSKEKKYERALKRALKIHKCECLKVKVIGESGFMDRLVINASGIYYPCEVKDEGKYADPLQISFCKRLLKVGVRPVLINSQEKLDKFIFYVIHSLPIPEDSDLTHFEKPGSA